MKRTLLLVTDSNIWIDLENGNILESIIKLPIKFVTTNLVIDEVLDNLERKINALNIDVKVLSPMQITQIYIKKQETASCSIPDLSAFLLAKQLSTILLSGDKALNKYAQENDVEVHGVLWVMDQLFEMRFLSGEAAANALERMVAKNARLPVDECQKRIRYWRAA